MLYIVEISTVPSPFAALEGAPIAKTFHTENWLGATGQLGAK
jgi:hypothetical protein